jgi:hypothetical protein
MSKGVKGLWDESEHERIKSLSDKRGHDDAMAKGNCKACDHARKKKDGNPDAAKIEKGRGYFFCHRQGGPCEANK